MALYRLHRKVWDKDFRPVPIPGEGRSRKRKRDAVDIEDDVAQEEETQAESTTKPVKSSKVKVQAFPGGGRKGLSSGLSTIIKRQGVSVKPTVKTSESSKQKWWTTLGSSSARGSKGSVRIHSSGS